MPVNLSPAAGAAAQFFTDNGVPLAGGLIYTYAAGTTTPQAAYTSSTGGTAWSNPIILNSAGRVSGGGEIWLTGNLAYKFVLYDSTSVLIATYDQIRGVGDTTELLAFEALLAGSTGSSLVGFLQAGTGAIATTVQTKLRQTVSVMDFMTAAQIADIQAGAASLNVASGVQIAVNTGKDIYFPPGVYRVDTAILFGTSDQTFFGCGVASEIRTTVDIEAFYCTATLFGVVFRYLWLHNTVSETVTGPTQFQIHFGNNSSGCIVERCTFSTALTAAIVRITHHGGVWFDGGNLNRSLDCTYNQAHVLIGSTDTTIRGGFIYAHSSQYAIKIISTGEIIVDSIQGILGGADKGCIWIPNATYMVKIVNNYFGGTYSNINIGAGITADQPQVMQIIGNTFHEIDKDGIHLTNVVTGTTIMGNSFFAGYPKQNDPTGLIPGYVDIYIGDTLFASSNVTIVGNVFDRFVGPVEDGMPGIGKSNAIALDNVPYTTVNNIVNSNTILGVGTRYFDPPISDSSYFNSVNNNAGAKGYKIWTPSDLSGAGLVFTNVNCHYLNTIDTVTVWGSFTFPATASVAGVTIGGLPQAPIAGMVGAIGALDSSSAAVQKVRLATGQQYFFLCSSVAVQVSNAACSGLTFNFSGTYCV